MPLRSLFRRAIRTENIESPKAARTVGMNLSIQITRMHRPPEPEMDQNGSIVPWNERGNEPNLAGWKRRRLEGKTNASTHTGCSLSLMGGSQRGAIDALQHRFSAPHQPRPRTTTRSLMGHATYYALHVTDR